TLAEVGAKVVCAARTQAEIDDTTATIAERGGEALALSCDVSDGDARTALIDATLQCFGRIDVLVNHAGGTPPRVALQTDDAMFDEALHFNCTSAFSLSRQAAAHMLAGDGGAIVNVSSAMSHLVDSGFVAYGTGKAALNHMTRLCAHEWAPRVRV